MRLPNLKQANCLAFFLWLIIGCITPASNENTAKNTNAIPVLAIKNPKYCVEEQALVKAGLVDIQAMDSTVLVELRYSTTNNFMNEDVYGNINHAFLQRQAAQQLAKASSYLQKKHHNLRFLVYDAARSRAVQWKLWNAKSLANIPARKREDFVADPRIGSIHNSGCAVDLTLATAQGEPLDMGTPYDFFGNLAYPRHEVILFKNKRLSFQQIQNRHILRSVMEEAGFMPIETEWWHFNALARKEAKNRYGIIE